MNPAFKLRRQYQENDDKRKSEGDINCGRGLLEFPAQAPVTDPRFRWQVIHSQVVQIREGRAEIVAVSERGTDNYRRKPVNTAQVRIGTHLLHRNQRLQRDQVATLTGPQKDLPEVFRRRTVGILCLDDHIVLTATVEVSGDLSGRQHGLECQPHILDGDVQIGGPFAVNGDPQFRPGKFKVCIKVLKIRVFPGPLDNLVTPGLDRFVVRAGNHELNRLAESSLTQARRVYRQGPDT